MIANELLARIQPPLRLRCTSGDRFGGRGAAPSATVLLGQKAILRVGHFIRGGSAGGSGQIAAPTGSNRWRVLVRSEWTTARNINRAGGRSLLCGSARVDGDGAEFEPFAVASGVVR